VQPRKELPHLQADCLFQHREVVLFLLRRHHECGGEELSLPVHAPSREDGVPLESQLVRGVGLVVGRVVPALVDRGGDHALCGEDHPKDWFPLEKPKHRGVGTEVRGVDVGGEGLAVSAPSVEGVVVAQTL